MCRGVTKYGCTEELIYLHCSLDLLSTQNHYLLLGDLLVFIIHNYIHKRPDSHQYLLIFQIVCALDFHSNYMCTYEIGDLEELEKTSSKYQ